ncbi:MAG: hypothetical protein IJ736_10660 [Firmicutes bacterium]|nr:hypothetical protein [Bacillota bacterium]
MIKLNKKFSVKETTKIQREKIVNDALAISTLDASEPTDMTKALMKQYIMGNMEISEILGKTIARYRVM